MKDDITNCPLCGKTPGRPLLKEFSYLRKCGKCGIVFNSGFRPQEYSDRYFLDDYRGQYGKSYLEDFDNIYRLSAERLKKIDSLLPAGKGRAELRLLDIGSALGFFLKAAVDHGYKDASGIEISEYASFYCKNQLSIPVINSSFDDAVLSPHFDVITAWYFIEHNRRPAEAVRRIYDALNKNGIFAFSLPSIFGPQYIFNRKGWARSHPADHRIDFSPSSVKRFLKKIGFSRVVTCPGGIHPGRIYPEAIPGFKIFSRFYRYFSHRFSFSDTLEVYAVK